MCDGCGDVGQQIATRHTTTPEVIATASTVLAHQYDRPWLACTCGFEAIDRPTWATHVAHLLLGVDT